MILVRVLRFDHSSVDTGDVTEELVGHGEVVKGGVRPPHSRGGRPAEESDSRRLDWSKPCPA